MHSDCHYYCLCYSHVKKTFFSTLYDHDLPAKLIATLFFFKNFQNLLDFYDFENLFLPLKSILKHWEPSSNFQTNSWKWFTIWSFDQSLIMKQWTPMKISNSNIACVLLVGWLIFLLLSLRWTNTKSCNYWKQMAGCF